MHSWLSYVMSFLLIVKCVSCYLLQHEFGVKNWFHTKNQMTKRVNEKGRNVVNHQTTIFSSSSIECFCELRSFPQRCYHILLHMTSMGLTSRYPWGSIVVKKHNIFHVNALVCYCCAETPIKLIHFPSFLIISLKFWMLYDAMELDFYKQEIERGREGG